MEWILLVSIRSIAGCYERGNKPSSSINDEEFLDPWTDWKIPKMNSSPRC
jgi:hypothetical protein